MSIRVAHTYLAAESLEIATKKNNVEIDVETQGSIGIENELTSEQIKEAEAVILTNNIGIKNEERFKGKPVVRVSAETASIREKRSSKKYNKNYQSRDQFRFKVTEKGRYFSGRIDNVETGHFSL